MSQVKIVTDSNVYLAPGVVSTYDIQVVPLRVQIGTRVYREGIDSHESTYFTRLARQNALPVDRPPPQEDFDELYARLHRETDQILSVHVSSHINNACAVARAAAAQLLGRCQIAVLDSQTVSLGLGILVEAAALAAASGMRLDDIVRQVRGMVPHLYGVFFVDTLPYLERSKRISKAQAVLGSMLGIKPLLQVEDGEIIPVEKVQTRERAVEKLIEFVGEFSHIEQVAILQHNYDADADSLLKQLRTIYPDRQVFAAGYGPSLACHLGPSAIGVIVYEGLI